MTATLDLTVRMRRRRGHAALRGLLQETHLLKEDFVLPLFVRGDEGCSYPISSLPGHSQWSVDRLGEELVRIVDAGVSAVLLFGIPEVKDACGSASSSPVGVIQRAVAEIKKRAPGLLVITDLCFCSYTSHGHCGVLQGAGNEWGVDNDATLELLANQAVSHARAGADVLAPSGMMDGMVKAIRKSLDEEGFSHVPILSYAVKYCSALYGAFREAADSTPQFGDRKTYQMDPSNGDEALREAALDLDEGADMLMVKPAGSYQDVIYRIKRAYPGVPLAAYHVSGEFAMIKAAAAKGWVDERAVALEALTGIKRAGADFIITYYAKEAAEWVQQNP